MAIEPAKSWKIKIRRVYSIGRESLHQVITLQATRAYLKRSNEKRVEVEESQNLDSSHSTRPVHTTTCWTALLLWAKRIHYHVILSPDAYVMLVRVSHEHTAPNSILLQTTSWFTTGANLHTSPFQIPCTAMPHPQVLINCAEAVVLIES